MEYGFVKAKTSTLVLFASSHSHDDTSTLFTRRFAIGKLARRLGRWLLAGGVLPQTKMSSCASMTPYLKLMYHLTIRNSMDICQSGSSRSARICGPSETYKFHPQ